MRLERAGEQGKQAREPAPGGAEGDQVPGPARSAGHAAEHDPRAAGGAAGRPAAVHDRVPGGAERGVGRRVRDKPVAHDEGGGRNG